MAVYEQYLASRNGCGLCEAMGKGWSFADYQGPCRSCRELYNQEIADIKSGKRNPPPGMSEETLKHFNEWLWIKLKIIEAVVEDGGLSVKEAEKQMKELITKANEENEYSKKRREEEQRNAQKILPKFHLY